MLIRRLINIVSKLIFGLDRQFMDKKQMAAKNSGLVPDFWLLLGARVMVTDVTFVHELLAVLGANWSVPH